MDRSYHACARPITADQCAELDALKYPGKYPKTKNQAFQLINRLKGIHIPTDGEMKVAEQSRRESSQGIARQSGERVKDLRKLSYAEYLRTEWWDKIRKAALARAEYRCQVCYENGTMHVHHRNYLRIGWEKDSDLTVLCVRCHALFHNLIPK